MRRHAKSLSNFFGATKQLTSDFIELAGITADELNQMRQGLMDRPDRKATAKLLAAQGLSTRQIAEITGWSKSAIAEDLAVQNRTENLQNRTSFTGSPETKAKRAEVAEAAAGEGVTDEPVEKYRIVYADCPWDYGAHAQPDYQTEQRDHYPVMSVEAIGGLPVKDWVEDNAVLFFWVTAPILERSFEVIRAWGFTYKTHFVWDENQAQHGPLQFGAPRASLICTRGACQPDKQQLFDSVQSIERGAHSAKPVEFYDIIETLYVHGRKLEIFARERREGWDPYGHVAEIAKAAE